MGPKDPKSRGLQQLRRLRLLKWFGKTFDDPVPMKQEHWYGGVHRQVLMDTRQPAQRRSTLATKPGLVSLLISLLFFFTSFRLGVERR
jgi:hypothetical protein